MITFDDFKKIEMRVGQILSAERVPETDKLLKLSVDFGETGEAGEKKARQVVSGIAAHFPDPTVLAGQKYVFVTNLEPRLIRDLESQAMILAASAADNFSLLNVNQDLPPGSLVK